MLLCVGWLVDVRSRLCVAGDTRDQHNATVAAATAAAVRGCRWFAGATGGRAEAVRGALVEHVVVLLMCCEALGSSWQGGRVRGDRAKRTAAAAHAFPGHEQQFQIPQLFASCCSSGGMPRRGGQGQQLAVVLMQLDCGHPACWVAGW